MSLEIIQLPDFVLVELYKNSLVEMDEKPAGGIQSFAVAKELEEEKLQNGSEDLTTPTRAPLKFLGENKKNVIVLVNEPKALIINENELEFLTKILTACRLTIADIAIVNTDKQEVTFQILKEELQVAHLLMLGVEPSAIKLPFTIPHFQVQSYSDSKIVYTPNLSGMLTNNEESRLQKSKLWVSLKTAFNL
jgi:hypothetical protein